MKLSRRGACAPIAVLFLLASLSGCASYRSYQRAQSAELSGDWDQAVLEYLELTRRDPTNLRYRAALLRAKIKSSQTHFEQAKRYQEAKLWSQALVELQQAVQLDPTNQYARSELGKVREEIAAAAKGQKRETLAEMEQRTEGARALPPVLNPRSPEPIDLSFPEPVSVMEIYRTLGKAFGINVLFDTGLRDTQMKIELNDVTAEKALEIVMQAANHFYKVIDEHSIIIVADTPQNRRKYEDLIIQTFFLSNADVKEVMGMLRSLVDARKIAQNEQLNAIVIRDKADTVKIAERIIRANDKAKAEVVVDVELLQLNTRQLQDLGLSLSDYSVGAQIDTGTSGGGTGDSGGGAAAAPLRLNDLRFLDANSWVLTVPSFLFNFVKSSTQAQTLANPSMRITEGEQGRVTIADRVPIPVTSFNTGNTVGGSIVPVTSFQYQDVGITIEIEPRVHHNDEISLKLMVEVSNLNGSIGQQPIIGTRKIESAIRLKDGETNFLAGLVRTEESNDEQGLPGLSEIPVLGRLFSKKKTDAQRTDIVLTLTPHIIRRADITEEDLLPIWVGTETNLALSDSRRVDSEFQSPFEGDEGNDADIEELRQRLQQLPPGLQPGRRGEVGSPLNQPGAQQQQEQEQRPAGQNLVPPFDNDNDDSNNNRSDLREETMPWGHGRFGQGLAGLGARLASASIPLMELALQEPSRGRRPRIPAAGELKMALDPALQQVDVGQDFEVRITVDTSRAFAHLPLSVRFDADLLQLRDVFSTNLFANVGEHQVLFKEVTPGSAVLGVSLIGPSPGINKDGRAVRLRFRALKPGDAKVEITRAEALDPNLVGLRVQVTRPEATVDIIAPGGNGSDPQIPTAGGGLAPR